MRPPLAAFLVSLLLVSSGCLGFWQSAPSDPGAEAVVEDAIDTSDDVGTYQVAMDMRATESEGRDSRQVHVAASVDRADRRMHLSTTTDDTNRSVYLIGNTTYTECADPWGGWGIETHEELDRDWQASDPLGRQLELLASSPVTWAGNESVDGVDTHVVEARPSERTLRQFSNRQRGLIDPTGPNLENTTFTAWIGADSARLLRTVLEFEVVGDGQRAVARMTTTFHAYGEPVAVTLPTSATEDPYELGCPQG